MRRRNKSFGHLARVNFRQYRLLQLSLGFGFFFKFLLVFYTNSFTLVYFLFSPTKQRKRLLLYLLNVRIQKFDTTSGDENRPGTGVAYMGETIKNEKDKKNTESELGV